MSTYYMISNSEDGIQVRGPLNQLALQSAISDITGPDIRLDCQAEFVTTVPDEYTDERKVLILKAEIVQPQPKTVVTEWEIT